MIKNRAQLQKASDEEIEQFFSETIFDFYVNLQTFRRLFSVLYHIIFHIGFSPFNHGVSPMY